MSMDLPLPLSRFAISHRKPHYNHHRSNYAYISVKSQLKKKQLEGVSEELNLIATQSLDHAPARRRVRSVFVDIQQQLDHPLFKMAPDGIKTKEWYEMNSKGMEIFCKSWMPELGVKVKGVVCFCHGYGDTCTFFFEGVARRIADAGYAVFALDHPGFGLSDGLHGYISSFDQLADNVNEIYRKIKGRDEFRGLPFFILGQSMGGAITLKAHLMDPFGWDGIILVAPMCKIAEEIMPPQPVMKALIMMSKWMPKAKLVPQQDLAVFSFRDLNKRNMTHFNVIGYNDQVRLKTAVELLNATKDIEAQVDKVSAPLLILHGAADKVTDPLISKFLYEKAASRDKTLKLYEGGYHSILEGEPDDRILSVFDDIISWLDVRSCPV